MQFPAELGLSISIISDTESLGGPTAEYPSFLAKEADEFPLYCIIAGGGPRGSGVLRETGSFPNKFFSMPVCTIASHLKVISHSSRYDKHLNCIHAKMETTKWKSAIEHAKIPINQKPSFFAAFVTDN